MRKKLAPIIDIFIMRRRNVVVLIVEGVIRKLWLRNNLIGNGLNESEVDFIFV